MSFNLRGMMTDPVAGVFGILIQMRAGLQPRHALQFHMTDLQICPQSECPRATQCCSGFALTDRREMVSAAVRI